jgi:hypothetical protein
MVKKQRSGGGSRGLVGQAKKFGRMAGRIVGIVVVLSPVIKAVADHAQSDPQNIPHHVIYNYVGFDDTSGTVNYTQTAAGLGTVVAGVAVMKLIGWALR